MASVQDVMELGYGANVMWVLLTATFVVFLQAGFALREVGTVQTKNTNDILYKFLLIGAITAITWWILGYGFAFGNTKGGFLGVSLYGLDAGQFEWNTPNKAPAFQSFFQAWAYAITAMTIATGSLGERVKMQTVLILVAALSIWIYPIIVHWCWGQGWLSPFANQQYDYLFYGKDSNNYIDAAGSGVVHTVGGVTALIGAIALGARKGRFDSNVIIRKNNTSLIVAGTLIFWVCYYGYNCGSTGSIIGVRGALAGKIAAVTTLSAAFSAVTMLLIQAATNVYDISVLSNAILAGLVGVSASCTVIEMWGAMLIGISSCLVYFGASKALVHFKIDDVVDAFAVHGAVGIWGALNVGIFGSDYNAGVAGYVGSSSTAAHAHPFRTGEQFGVQLVGIICIVAWTAFWTALVFFGLKLTVGIRVADEVEENGDVELVETRDEASQAKLSGSAKV